MCCMECCCIVFVNALCCLTVCWPYSMTPCRLMQQSEESVWSMAFDFILDNVQMVVQQAYGSTLKMAWKRKNFIYSILLFLTALFLYCFCCSFYRRQCYVTFRNPDVVAFWQDRCLQFRFQSWISSTKHLPGGSRLSFAHWWGAGELILSVTAV